MFRALLDAIEGALPEDLRKAAVTQWLGSLMIPPYKYKVFTVKDPHASVPFTGPRLTEEAPGGAGTSSVDNAGSRSRATGLSTIRFLMQS